MKKLVVVINGAGGVGKDTMCSFAAQAYKVRNVSSVDPIKAIARMAGWDGDKSDKSRKMLSDLKMLFTEYNDLCLRYIKEQYGQFLEGDEQVMFVHIREPEEIARLQQAIGENCKTLLIRRDDPQGAVYGNRSDDQVENYAYDLYFDNNIPLSELPNAVKIFFKKFLESC